MPQICPKINRARWSNSSAGLCTQRRATPSPKGPQHQWDADSVSATGPGGPGLMPRDPETKVVAAASSGHDASCQACRQRPILLACAGAHLHMLPGTSEPWRLSIRKRPQVWESQRRWHARVPICTSARNTQSHGGSRSGNAAGEKIRPLRALAPHMFEKSGG